jgi:hypothetical protein
MTIGSGHREPDPDPGEKVLLYKSKIENKIKIDQIL